MWCNTLAHIQLETIFNILENTVKMEMALTHALLECFGLNLNNIIIISITFI